MTTDPDNAADRDAPEADPLAVELRSVVVEHDQRPDQRTVFPDEASGVERMVTWLTADADAFVDLESVR